MKKHITRFLMSLMAAFLVLEALPQKAEAAGNDDTDTVAEQTAHDDPGATGMTEGSGTDLFGNYREFPCWYNKEKDLYYMEAPAEDIYVFDSRQWTVTRAYRIVDTNGKEHLWYGATKGNACIFEDGCYIIDETIFDENDKEIGAVQELEMIGYSVGYGKKSLMDSLKELLSGNYKTGAEEVLESTVTSNSSVFSASRDSDHASAVTAMAGVAGVKNFYEDLFHYSGPVGSDGTELPFFVFCNDSQYYYGSWLGLNSYSTTYYDSDLKKDCAMLALGYDTNMTTYPVIGHEVTHRYFDCLVKAAKCDEKSALDEGFSDIMGFLFADWFDGEESQKAEDRMDGSCEWTDSSRNIKTIAEGTEDYPTIYRGEHWDPDNEAHQNSTVISVAAYKMMQAPDKADQYERLSSYQLANLFFDTMKAMDEAWDCDYPHCAYALRSVAVQMVNTKQLNQKQADYVDHILEEAGLPASSAPEDTKEKNTTGTSADIAVKAPVTVTENGQQVTEWDCVWFGNYWQDTDSNGDGKVDRADSKDPVKWRILSYDEASGEALLLADRNLDILKYNEKEESVDWEMSTIRSFLNSYNWTFNQDKEDYSSNGFLKNAFTQKEAAAILDTLVVNEDNALFGSEGGAETMDKVFCLSLDEALNATFGFLETEIKGKGQEWTKPDSSRVSYNTAFVADKEGYSSRPAGSAQRWWLRSPAYTSAHAAHSDNDGAVNFTGMTVTHNDSTVRPAIRINLKTSAGLWTYAGTVSSLG